MMRLRIVLDSHREVISDKASNGRHHANKEPSKAPFLFE